METIGREEPPPPHNGNLHHEVPAHPGVPLAPPGIVPESDVRTHSPAAAIPPKEHGFVEELGELPLTYGDGRLVALIRDPQTIYVYWDLSQQQIEQAFGGLGTARASLKLWNVRGNELVREVEVHLESRGWYLRELPSALELRVELWALGERGARMLRAARRPRRRRTAAGVEVGRGSSGVGAAHAAPVRGEQPQRRQPALER